MELQVEISEKDIVPMLIGVESTVVRARVSAFRKTGSRIQTSVRRGLAARFQAPQKAFASRIRIKKLEKDSQELVVWIGTKPFSLFRLGKVQAYGTPGRSGGVDAGRYRYEGAFLKKVFGHRENVWIRARSKYFNPEIFPGKPVGKGASMGDKRFPVVKATVSWRRKAEDLANAELPQYRAWFKQYFAHDFQYFSSLAAK